MSKKKIEETELTKESEPAKVVVNVAKEKAELVRSLFPKPGTLLTAGVEFDPKNLDHQIIAAFFVGTNHQLRRLE